MSKALIVVDLQVDFCEGGNLPVVGGNEVATRVSNLIAGPDYKVIAVTKDWHINPGNHFARFGEQPDYVDSWPVHCVAGTMGAGLHKNIALALMQASGWRENKEIEHFRKGMYDADYSGFDGENSHDVPMDLWLLQHGVDAVDIVGLAFDYCVKETALDAVGRGFTTRVLTYYTAAVNPEEKLDAERALLEQGVLLVVGA